MKGPPQAPLILLPNAVSELEVRRIGNQVYVEFEVPEANTDGSTPADLDFVEVYSLTTDPEQDQELSPSLEDWLEAATLVASLDVSSLEGEVPDNPKVTSVELGELAVVVEVLEPGLFEPYVFEDDSDSDDDESDDFDERLIAQPLVSPPLPRPTRRTYLVRGVSTRGRESEPSTRVEVPLIEPTPPPLPPTVTYTETEFVVEWTPAVGARHSIQASDGRNAEEFSAAEDDAPLASRPVIEVATPSNYLVYAVGSRRAGDIASLPSPLNMAEVDPFSYRDQSIRFGSERCFVVRVLDVLDSLRIQGAASPPTCVVPVDTFPPKSPTGLVAVASEGAISLVWDPNEERDITGYLILRREPTGATLETITLDLIEGTSYRDEEVMADQDYVYAVMAVDNATPPNVSVASVEIAEQAR